MNTSGFKIPLLAGIMIAAVPTLAAASMAEPAIPAGWKLLSSVQGDLNRDGQADLVRVIEEDNPANHLKNDGLGQSVLNINPRRLHVFLQQNGAYQPVLNTDRFLPSENNADSHCLADPLQEGGEVAVKNGLLHIQLHYWLSCGSWYVTHNAYTFRYQDGRFRLIGWDSSSFHRASGERSEYSHNYLTGKRKTVTGLNEFEPNARPKTRWTRLSGPQVWYLDALEPNQLSVE